VRSARRPGAVAARRRPGPRRRWLIAPWAVAAVLCLSTIYPIVFVACTAFKTPPEYGRSATSVTFKPTTASLAQAWNQGDVARTALNSAIVVIGAVVVIIIASSMAGWALATMRFRLRTITSIGVLGMMMMPPAMLLIPLFGVVKALGLVNNWAGLILVYASMHIPFATYLMSSYMRGIPSELIHAADVDGAGPLRTFYSIGLPIARPAVLTVATLTFLWLWNELLFGLVILQDPAKRTLMVGLATLQGQFSTPAPLLAAGMLLSMLPALIVFVIFQRNLASGLVAGALK
jgi:multiple sugar transport system permease protein